MKSITTIPVAVVWVNASASMTDEKMSLYFNDPILKKIRNIATMKPQSPTRLVTNAFLPAVALAGSSCQKEMRK